MRAFAMPDVLATTIAMATSSTSAHDQRPKNSSQPIQRPGAVPRFPEPLPEHQCGKNFAQRKDGRKYNHDDAKQILFIRDQFPSGFGN